MTVQLWGTQKASQKSLTPRWESSKAAHPVQLYLGNLWMDLSSTWWTQFVMMHIPFEAYQFHCSSYYMLMISSSCLRQQQGGYVRIKSCVSSFHIQLQWSEATAVFQVSWVWIIRNLFWHMPYGVSQLVSAAKKAMHSMTRRCALCQFLILSYGFWQSGTTHSVLC